ncbi:cysteine desulfurase [Clostridium sp. D2Q-14]|uniref:cysteine desulfurase family protein n=1 Tax=Anaeromonas gelatinilytica TaxID=2683194 RepID=UPI00193B2EFB|nr:cysteine desulfurase family protein [Anaeromonas gelatinilytica]MBS4534581.1 cysteine desulfurase [Anaeromonas gelatinilytica]
MLVYLDNSATTRARDKVIDEMNIMLKRDYGNPSSLHRMGLNVEKRIKEARNIISDYLNVKKEEIFFTSGGTESNNLAIQGIINKYNKKGKHVITSKIEHSSVLNVFSKYEKMGYDVTYLDINNDGTINLEQFKKEIREDTILVSIMMVNNETGTIQPIEEVKKIIKGKNPEIKLHVDGVQAFSKIEFNINKLDVDTFSFSSHKIHGPKGIGGIYIKKDLNINPIFYGGNQEMGLRSGTENTPGIIGLGKAVDILRKSGRKEREEIKKLKNYFLTKVEENIDDIRINSFKDDRCSSHIANISFLNIKGEVLLHFLEDDDIYVSTGSACSSKEKTGSHVLKAMKLSDEEIEGAIRFSFSFYNTKEQIDYAIERLKERVEEIRDIMMR